MWVLAVFAGSACGTYGWHAVTSDKVVEAQKVERKDLGDVTVRSLVLVDEKGRTRASLAIQDNGAATFSFNDNEARSWLQLGAGQDEAAIQMQVPGGKEPAGLSLIVSREGASPEMSLYSTNGVGLVRMSIVKDNPELVVSRGKMVDGKSKTSTIGMRISEKSTHLLTTPYFEDDVAGYPTGSLIIGFDDAQPLEIKRLETKDSPTWPPK